MKTVLLAESHGPTLHHVAELLTQAGYEVETALDPAEALERFLRLRPDAVVVGADLPELEKVPLSVKIRATRWGSAVPILAIDRGHLGKARGVKAILDFKANGYVPDPLKPGELAGKLQALLAPLPEHDLLEPPGASQLLANPAAAAGELKTMNLPTLVRQLHRGARSGILVLSRSLGVRRLFILKGRLVRFDSNRTMEWLTHHLKDQGLFSAEQLPHAWAALKRGRSLGSTLSELGVTLPDASLAVKLAEYLVEMAPGALSAREGRYAFHEGEFPAGDWEGVELALPALMLAGARDHFTLRTFVKLLQPLLTKFPARSATFAADLPALGLSATDLKVAMQLNGRLRLRDLVVHGRGTVRESSGLLWFLSLMGSVTFADSPLPGGTEAEATLAEPLVARRKKSLPEGTVHELREAGLKILTGSYFNALGISIAAAPKLTEMAFQETSIRFHPDSYPEFDLATVQGLLDAVLEKLTASYRILSDEEKRKAYLQHLLSRHAFGRQGQPQAEAEILLCQGDEALKRGDCSTAVFAYEAAIALNAKEPEYFNRLAWASFQATVTSVDERVKTAQRHLKRALALQPASERAQVIFAITENENGQAAAARKRLLQLLEKNPQFDLARAALRKVGR